MAGGTPFLLPPLSAAHAADSVQIVWNHGGQLVALVLESLVLTRPFRSTHVQSAVLVAVVFSYALFTYVYYLAGGTCPTRPGERYIYAQLQYGNPTFHGTNTAALAALAVTTIFLAAVHWRVGQKLAGAGKAGSLPPVGGDTWRRPGWCDRSAAVLSALIFTSAVVTFSAGSVR